MALLRSSAARARSQFAARAFGSTTVNQQEYDVCVVGGGPGGYVAAIKAGQLGMKTVCVEGRGKLGGTCLNVGCIPSKSMLHSSHLYEHAAKNHLSAHGINVEGVELDLAKMHKAKTASIRGLTGGIEHLLKKNKVDYVKGWGKLSSANDVSVTLSDGSGNQTITAKNIVMATGSEVTPLPPCPVDNEQFKIVDSTGALDIPSVPEKLVVVGGGVIGLEMGSVWRRLGSEVTVVEFLDEICPGMDKEVTKEFRKILKKQGMKFELGTKVTSSEVQADGKVRLTTEPSAGGEATDMMCDVVLVATGRRPLTKDIGLEEMGIPMDNLGRIQVDHSFRTNVPSVWAIGDCIDGPMLAHKAEEEGIACIENIAGKVGHVNYDAIPGVIYTYPEVAVVGKTEEELKEAGVGYNVGKFPMMANSRARTVMEGTEGIVKFLSDKETDRVLGIHIIGSNAGEMIAEGVLGMEYGAAAEDIGRTCHAHPTLSEGFKEAAMACYDKPIHF